MNTSTPDQDPFSIAMAITGRRPRFDLEHVPETNLIHNIARRAANLCSFVVSKEYKVDRSISFGFTSDTDIDSVAVTHDNKDYIGVSIGTPLVLLETFGRLLSDKSVFPKIGHPRLEISEPIKGFVPRDAFGLDIELPRPQCKIRGWAANSLAFMALDFLISHEITHIEQGHLVLLDSLKLKPELNETNSITSEKLTKQALELNADLHGATRVLRRAYGDYLEIKKGIDCDRHLRKAMESMNLSPSDAVYFPFLQFLSCGELWIKSY